MILPGSEDPRNYMDPNGVSDRASMMKRCKDRVYNSLNDKKISDDKRHDEIKPRTLYPRASLT